MGKVLDGRLELDTESFEVRRAGEHVPLEPQAFDVLAYLVEHRDRLVSKEELMDRVWGGRFVTEAAVTSRIKQVRRALGDDGQAQRLVRTVHGRGYRFVGDVTEAGTATVPRQPAPSPSPPPTPSGATSPIRYTVSDGLHIAYQVTGSGPVDIVLISGFVSHLELDWDDPRHAHFLDRLGTFGRLIRFDKRGTGMSDRPDGVPDLETRIQDVLSVMDAAGSDRAVVFGYSEGGAMATLLAATQPQRVEALVLYGSYAKRTRSEDYPWGQDPTERAAYTERLVTTWDWESDLRMRVPTGDEAMAQWWSRRMRAAATPSTVRALMDMNSLVDVRLALSAVRCPALVLHRRGDELFRVEEAEYLAEHLPHSRLRVIDGVDHFVSGDPDQILDEVQEFLDSVSGGVHSPTALMAVVAVDGAGAALVVDALASAGGRLRRAGARPVVLFDGPATAVRAALSHARATQTVGVALGQLPRDDPEVRGRGVDVALALAECAEPGTVSVSSATRTLLSGSGLTTEPAEPVQAPGIGEVAVYRARRSA